VPLVTAETCYNDAAVNPCIFLCRDEDYRPSLIALVQLYILLAVATNPTELDRKLDCIALLSRVACIHSPRSITLSFAVADSLLVLMPIFSRSVLLRKVHLGRFVTCGEKEALLTDCPAKWRTMFHTSLSLHHLHACFKIYDNISVDALKLRMDCSEDDCYKCVVIPAL
jgi:hypothetical protein